MASALGELRAAQRITKRELAAELGVHPRTIHRWERGETPIPRKHWYRLAARFGVPVAYLLGLERSRST